MSYVEVGDFYQFDNRLRFGEGLSAKVTAYQK